MQTIPLLLTEEILHIRGLAPFMCLKQAIICFLTFSNWDFLDVSVMDTDYISKDYIPISSHIIA